MILVVGGRASGKREYVRNRFALEPMQVSPDEAMLAPVIDSFQEVIRQVLVEGKDMDSYLETLMGRNPEAIILCDEVGMGIVPLARTERVWREAVGRACCRLAQQSAEVIRVVCGLEQRVK